MIRNSRDLKAKIKQFTKGDSLKSQSYLRSFFMERFLERISESPYKERFILKGGLLIASLVGLDLRSTMDIDSTVKGILLNQEEATEVIQEISETPVDDSVSFVISKITKIMDEHDYSGFRFALQGSFDGIRQAIKIDLSTGDVITPRAISYDYHLMFEERSIRLMTYNLETLLAEKLETMLARGTANTRMRDFYDVYLLTKEGRFDLSVLKKAIVNTSNKRGTKSQLENYSSIMHDVSSSEIMKSAWNNFVNQSYFVGEISWEEVADECFILFERVLSQ